jgi:dienelactone hydrolase
MNSSLHQLKHYTKLVLAGMACTLFLLKPAQAQSEINWDLKVIRQIPELIPISVAAETGVKSFYYTGLPYKEKPTWVYAYYGVPSGEKPSGGWPAVVLLHGGGGTAFAEWVRRWNAAGFAAIAMDLEGHQPDSTDPKKRPSTPNPGPAQAGAFADFNLPIHDQFTYHAVTQAMRANTLLSAFPEINAKKIGICGISWGSIWTSIVAGVDDRFAFAIPIYGHGFLNESEGRVRISKERAEKAMVWDPSRFIPTAKCPLFFIASTNDHSFVPKPWQRTIDLASASAQQLMIPNLAHSHQAAWEVPEATAFAKQVVTGNKLVSPFIVQGEKALRLTEPVKKAEFWFTTDSGPYPFRKWRSIEARIQGTQVSEPHNAEASRVTASFYLLTDLAGLRRSTPIAFNPAAEVELITPTSLAVGEGIVLYEQKFDNLPAGSINGQMSWTAKGMGAIVESMDGTGNVLSLAHPFTDATLKAPRLMGEETLHLRFRLKATPPQNTAPDATQKLLIYARDATGKVLTMAWQDGTGSWGVKVNGQYSQKPLAFPRSEWTEIELILDQKNRKITLKLTNGDTSITHYNTVDYSDLTASSLDSISFVRNKEGNPAKCYLDDVSIVTAKN